MKPTPKSPRDSRGSERRPPARRVSERRRIEPDRRPALQFLSPLLAFGAHPDDIEFGCGGVIAKETRAGRKAHFAICSRGEAASHGTPGQRVAEAKKSAALLGATVEFVELDGDAHLEVRATHAIKLAGIIRGWDNSCVMPAGSPVTVASRNYAACLRIRLSNCFITQ